MIKSPKNRKKKTEKSKKRRKYVKTKKIEKKIKMNFQSSLQFLSHKKVHQIWRL